jgi:hypothetical protein
MRNAKGKTNAMKPIRLPVEGISYALAGLAMA